MAKRFIYYEQQDMMDCGPTCLRMICQSYGRNYSIVRLRSLCHVSRQGTTLFSLSEAAEKLGLRSIGVQITPSRLQEIKLPVILSWEQNHYVVLYKIKNEHYYIADPANGLLKLEEPALVRYWSGAWGFNKGFCLALDVTPDFYKAEDDKHTKASWLSIIKYFYAYKRLFFQLALGMMIGSLLTLVTPFLSQAIVDVGIDTKNVNYVYLILIAQIMLFVGSTCVNFIRSWILLHISTRINISILTDFLIKLMKLPVSFFETKTTGDIMQRMNDQHNIESFLTGTTLNTVFSAINLFLFTIVLFTYDIKIFVVSLICTIIYTLWILMFLKKRRELNHKQFDNSSNNQTNIVELVNGMKEIKLNNAEKQKRWSWEHLQAKLFRYKIESLKVTQLQQGGSLFINQVKNIVITFLSVKAVIDGHITLGGMMAVQYIVGQINSPIEQMLAFIQNYQDAKISLERLGEIHELPDEEAASDDLLTDLPMNKSIILRNLTFRYPGAGNEPVLNKINLYIPEGKTTAIVGMSGSGKTTILKMLLRFYTPESGEIKIGKVGLSKISHSAWRKNCGSVLQDGFIFSDTIENNIALGDEHPDKRQLRQALEVANLTELIEELPLGLLTKIGAAGNSLSQGQKQRLLIARAVYKNPHYLFFDESTNALDANNEKIIMNNLNTFFKGKTVIIIAHRLSTVSNADNIIVMENGKITEQGTHKELATSKGIYYTLVKNQLELENS